MSLRGLLFMVLFMVLFAVSCSWYIHGITLRAQQGTLARQAGSLTRRAWGWWGG